MKRARLGSARLGSARLGSARLGSARLGSARLGSARLGSARLGSARLGSARLGSARLGSARLGSARLGSARLGSARLGSARLGSARLGSARLGSARLGSIIAPPGPTPGRIRESTSPRTPHAKATRRIPCPPAPFADVSRALSTAFSPSTRFISSLQPAVPMPCSSPVGSAGSSAGAERRPTCLKACAATPHSTHSAQGPRGNLLNAFALLFPVA